MQEPFKNSKYRPGQYRPNRWYCPEMKFDMARHITSPLLLIPVLLLLPAVSYAGDIAPHQADYTTHWVGLTSIVIFISALLLVSVEEFTHLRKSKPVLVSAGVIWALIAWAEQSAPGVPVGSVESAVRHNLLRYSELMLVILVVMTYVNAMSERQVFATLGRFICSKPYSYRQLFWASGLISFFLAPFIDNLAIALVAGAIVVALGGRNGRFIALACTNIVIAANAGGAFSPFGDLTTLMVWQADVIATDGALGFWSFFQLLPASVVSYLIPTAVMHFAVPKGRPEELTSIAIMRRGARRVILLFLATIATAVFFRGVLELPAAVGMLTGLSYLQFFGYYLKKTHVRTEQTSSEDDMGGPFSLDSENPFDIFTRIARSEWDTLFFLYGVAMSVGGLAYLGYLQLASDLLYGQMGATTANVSLGLMTILLEDIPVMYGVLAMMPDMSQAQWLLVTLAVGTGGSIISIGSAAGVALMGQARAHYTFFYHLRWTPIILLGYFCGIGVHLLLNPGI
jgi:Na+/H+ antiporter NhaD/arsenite permease-like protein